MLPHEPVGRWCVDGRQNGEHPLLAGPSRAAPVAMQDSGQHRAIRRRLGSPRNAGSETQTARFEGHVTGGTQDEVVKDVNIQKPARLHDRPCYGDIL
jgi:hypothetical protein